MTHMSKMTRSHTGTTGMRKGLSLVEMLISIILFGLIATIGFTYYKNYYDTSFAAKQLRIYTIIDQAAQLSNGYDLYTAKYGAQPTTIQPMVDAKILTAIPQSQAFVTDTGWVIDSNKSITTASGGNGVAFVYRLDSLVATSDDRVDYCNILNNAAYIDSNLSRVLADQNSSYELYTQGIALGNSEAEFYHCDENGTAATDLYLTFVKIANNI